MDEGYHLAVAIRSPAHLLEYQTVYLLVLVVYHALPETLVQRYLRRMVRDSDLVKHTIKYSHFRAANEQEKIRLREVERRLKAMQ